jgi:hypothetical protein
MKEKKDVKHLTMSKQNEEVGGWEQCCGSGFGRIRIILSDPDQHPEQADPDRYHFQANDKVDKQYFFPENFNMLSKNN